MTGAGQAIENSVEDGYLDGPLNRSSSSSFAESGIGQLGLSARASSPAKRSASERDESERELQNGLEQSSPSHPERSPKKILHEHVSPMPNRFKSMGRAGEEDDLIPSQINGMDLQPSEEPGAVDNYIDGDRNSKATSMASASDQRGESASARIPQQPSNAGRPSYDHQMKLITEITEDRRNLKDGEIGFAVSSRWISRVQARTTTAADNYDKQTREGEVGPVDNSDIVSNGETSMAGHMPRCFSN